MNLTEMERHCLTVYQSSEKVTLQDVARELEITLTEASELSGRLAKMGLLKGERARRITEDGAAALSDGEVGPAQELVTVGRDEGGAVRRKLTDVLGDEYLVEPTELYHMVSRNIIATGEGDAPPTRAEVYHVLNIMHQYSLNPWMKQLHAFRHKGKLQVMLGYDGWVKKALEFPGYEGTKYSYGEDVPVPGTQKKAPEWVECALHSRGRYPTVVRAYLDEWYVEPRRGETPWQKYPRNRLRQKAFTMAVREHCGIDLWDEVDREQFQYHPTTAEVVEGKTGEATEELRAKLAAAKTDETGGEE